MADEVRNDMDGTVHGNVVQAGQIDNVYLVGTQQQPPPRAHTDEWVRMVAESTVWQQVRQLPQTDRMRGLAIDIAEGLATMRDELDDRLAGDPWRDDDLVRRFGVRLDWLVAETRPELFPGEALLLALVPLLHQILWSRAVAEHRDVGPTDFELTETGDEPRASYEQFLRDHGDLIKRATLPELPERDNAGTEIGWWLFHRWLRQRMEVLREQSVATLCGHSVLKPGLVRELLKGLREAPEGLATPARVGDVDAVLPLFGGSPNKESFRRPMVLLLARAAHLAAIEVTDLSRDLVWHMGIPRPVRVGSLLTTVREADWPERADGVVLEAECEHEAVVEVLREHATRLGDLLRAIRLVAGYPAVQPLAGLPAWATGDQVAPRKDEQGKPMFSGWAKFRLDEERVRDLLMGEQLYQDRHMAIRELYQNALDACRYRQARELYRQRRWNLPPSGWKGEIRFEQGVEGGRHYLDCFDNGIGMGEDELKGVFAQAGVRFADLTEFREEQLDWRSVGVELYPNSRFGIGVLSYFMLADEIEVKTRRMGRDGKAHGPQLRVTISGPGHLFQIQEINENPEPGTCVRLYLKEPDVEGIAISWLDHLLVIADFHTTATHAGGDPWEWEPGVLRTGPDNEFIASPAGVGDAGELPVVWCEEGGGLLVDGLLTRPGVARGILRDSDDANLRGVVVNLTGPLAPRLSVDRVRILDDVSDRVEQLVTAAVPTLLACGDTLLDLDWLTNVANKNTRLADIITKALIDDGRVVCGVRNVDVGAVGWLPDDDEIVDGRSMSPGVPLPNHILLWRLLAYAPNKRLALLQAAAPEIDWSIALIAPAVPSDVVHIGEVSFVDDSMSQAEVDSVADQLDLGLRRTARRAHELNLLGCPVDVFPPDDLPKPDRILLSRDLDGESPWLLREKPVPLRHFVEARIRLGKTVAETAQWLANRGFDTSAAERVLDAELGPVDLQLLGARGLLDPAETPPIGHLVGTALRLRISVSEVSRRLTEFGFDTASLRWPDDVDTPDLTLLQMGPLDSGDRLDGHVSAWHIARVAKRIGWSPREVGERLAAFGLLVPERLPEQVRDGDDDLVLGADDNGVVPIGQLIFATRRQRISFEDAIARVAGYGLRPSIDPPPPLQGMTDLIVQSADLNGQPSWLPVDRPVPVTHLIKAYVKYDVAPADAAERLALFGYHVPHVPPEEAIALVEPEMLTLCDIDVDDPVSLDEMLQVCQAFRLPLLEVAERFRNIGLNVPDVVESIKAALAKVPRRV